MRKDEFQTIFTIRKFIVFFLILKDHKINAKVLDGRKVGDLRLISRQSQQSK